MTFVTRLAPSSTGRLHVGNVRTERRNEPWAHTVGYPITPGFRKA